MAYIKNKNSNKIFINADNAPMHIESEGEKLIKNLAAKQINTNTSINELLQQRKQFDKSTELIPITAYTSGQITLEKFQEFSTRLDNVESLRSHGLTTDEIQLYLDGKNGSEYLKEKYKNVCQDVLRKQLEDIEIKIKENQPQGSSTNISRHDQELLSVKPESDETKLYKFILESSNTAKKDDTPPEHPINHLNELEKNLFGNLQKDPVPSLSKRRKKMKKIDKFDQEISKYTPVEGTKQSLWDMKEMPLTPTKLCQNFLNDTNENKKVYTCKRQQLYTISDGKIIKLEDRTEPLRYQQLTEDEIKAIPKFGNYHRGIPSKVLFIKNIANSARNEIEKLFEPYPNIDCKFMTGKMKGQAFVTFQSVEQATEVLLKYNGYVIKQKPIIIQYGNAQ